ncbi:CLIPB15 [Trypoxylus dichotomus]
MVRLQVNFILHIVFLVTIVNCQETKFATVCTTPNQAQGVCVEIKTCKRLYDQILQNNVKTFSFIKASRCDPETDVSLPKVCCGSDIDFNNSTAEDTTNKDITYGNINTGEVEEMLLPQPSIPSTTMRPVTGHSVLPRICGRQKIIVENRIFGGIEAGIGEFPWLVRLSHINRYNRTGLGCSGFLIHRKFVLTAAHCIVGKGVEHLGPLEKIILGMHNDTKARTCVDQKCSDPPRSVDVLPQIIHPEYNSSTHIHDIALIPLKERVDFTDFIKAICLPTVTTNAPSFTISGWGRTETDIISRTKLKVEIPRADKAECIMKYRTLGLDISEKQLCAGGERGHDSCSGDSGGPLMAMGDQNLWYAEGIVSYGNSCGREGWPGVYTYIPKYYEWIVEHIRATLRPNDY